MLTVAACAVLLAGCAKRPPGDVIRKSDGAGRSPTLAKGIGLFRQCKYEEALPLLERAVGEVKGNVEAHEWLAAVYYRLKRHDYAAAVARGTLTLDPCSSYAHSILAYTYNPQYSSWFSANADTTWQHLHAAVACDSSNGSALMGLWCESVRRGELDLSDEALRTMVQSGFLTPSLLTYNRWMLRHLPENALLVTNGDMDTYPAMALQVTEGFRRDVVIANQSLLNVVWYQRYLRDHYEVPLPFDDELLDTVEPYVDEEGNVTWVTNQIFSGWCEMKRRGTFPRPIAVSTSVFHKYIEGVSHRFVLAGAFSLLAPDSAGSTVDTAAVRRSLRSIDPDEFSGPFVSSLDRSPVRIMHTNGLASNVTVAAIAYAKAILEAGLAEEAYEVLTWAGEFEKKTVAGPVHAETISTFKERIEQHIQ